MQISLWILWIFAVTLYISSIFNELSFDDFTLFENPDVIQPLSFDIFKHDFWGNSLSAIDSHKSWRPFTIFTFRLNYLLSGENLWTYHVVNIYFHATNSVLVALLLQDFFAIQPLSMIAGLLFASHPICTEPVNTVVGRAELLYSFFYICAIRFYRNSCHLQSYFRCVYYYILSLASISVSFLCKEQAVTFILFILFLEFFQKPMLRLPFNRCSFWALPRILGVFIITFFYLYVRFNLSLPHIFPSFSNVDTPFIHIKNPIFRRFSLSWLPLYNIWLLIWPRSANFCADYSFRVLTAIESFNDYRIFVTIVSYSSLLGVLFCSLLLWLERPSRSNSVFQTAFAFLIVPFLPATNILYHVGFTVAERTLYLPAVGFCILLSFIIVKLSRLVYSKPNHIAMIVVSIYASQVVIRNPVWKSEYDLWNNDANNFCQNNCKANNNLAWALMEKGMHQDALDYAEKATLLECELMNVCNCSDNIVSQGVSIESLKRAEGILAIESGLGGDFETALKKFRRMRTMDPSLYRFFQFEVQSLVQRKMLEEILPVQRECARSNPDQEKLCWLQIQWVNQERKDFFIKYLFGDP